jgi:hypothetical protein
MSMDVTINNESSGINDAVFYNLHPIKPVPRYRWKNNRNEGKTGG